MDRRNEDTALLALRGGLRGRFRRSFDSMENAFEVLQDRLQHAVNPAERAELMPLLEELQTQLICLRRLGNQASDAATAALLHGTCVPQPIDLLGQLRAWRLCKRQPAAGPAHPRGAGVRSIAPRSAERRHRAADPGRCPCSRADPACRAA